MVEYFEEICERALVELSNIAQNYKKTGNEIEYSRILGKIEGISLALDYYRQEAKKK